MVARTRTAAKAEQSALKTETATQKTPSKTKQSTSISNEATKVATDKRKPAASATKVVRKTARRTAKAATPTQEAVQKSLSVEAATTEASFSKAPAQDKHSEESPRKTPNRETQPEKIGLRSSVQESSREISTQTNQTSPESINSIQTTNFIAANYATDSIWQPNAAIPTLDEADYATQKAQAEGQRRALEVASLNLENINSLHQLERQSIDIATSAQVNATHQAQLSGAEIDHQTQLEINGEKSQHLKQAGAKHQAAIRETGYADQLISLKDQNFELEIQQAQNVFAEKAARYRAQLTDQ